MLPPGVRLVRAANAGPMTLQGTNTWLLSGPDGTLVVDPGPDDERHLHAVIAAVGAGPLLGIVATHGHPDHVAGAGRLAALTGASVLPTPPDGRDLPGGRVRVLATPGHTADSVCLLVEGGVLTGDTVLGHGTTVIDVRAGGDLGAYLRSLELLTTVGERVVLPGHGDPRPSVGDAALELHEHRLARLEDVRQAHAAGAATAEQVVERVYPGLAPELRMAALLSTRAALAHLQG